MTPRPFMMSSRSKLLIFMLSSLVLAASSPAFADFKLSLGPTIGGGSTSDNEAAVRHASGFRMVAEPLQWALPGGFAIGPTAGLAYVLFNTKSNLDGRIWSATYDHRLGSLGAKLTYDPLPSQYNGKLFVAVAGGYGQGKLSIDETSIQTFKQSSFSGLRTQLISSEAGVEVPLQPQFSLFAGILHHSLLIDQKQAAGNFKGEQSENGKISLTAGNANAETAGLPATIRQNIWALNFGVNMGLN